jgi:hypothetical protein
VNSHRGTFALESLARVTPPARPVVLRSGGPVMDLVCVEGDHGVCEWDESDGDGTARRSWLLPLIALYECRPIAAPAPAAACDYDDGFVQPPARCMPPGTASQ